MVPSVGRMKPAIAFNSVVLPQPLGPTRAPNAPDRMVKSTLSVACTSPSAVAKKCRKPDTTILSLELIGSAIVAAPPRNVLSVDQRPFALRQRLRQGRQIGEELGMFRHDPVEHGVVVEILRHEGRVLLEQLLRQQIVSGLDQALDGTDRYPRGPTHPFQSFGCVPDIEPVEEAGRALG